MPRSKTELSLHDRTGARKYLNSAERRRFLESSQEFPARERLFCLLLASSGARISEILALTPAAVDIEVGTINILTLKRRKPGVVRQVPIPAGILRDLNRTFKLKSRRRDPSVAFQRLWSWSRTTAWRRIKFAMEGAGIAKTAAMPKGLRHTFGVRAFQANIPPHLIQRWLGHASLRTTAIYGDVSGEEERRFAARMWDDKRGCS